jgi:hypothetical protein
METAGILGERSPPGDRQREEQRVQSGVVEAFAEVAAGGHQNACI